MVSIPASAEPVAGLDRGDGDAEEESCAVRDPPIVRTLICFPRRRHEEDSNVHARGKEAR